MNADVVLGVLPEHKDQAMSIREIAKALGLEINPQIDKRRTKQRLCRALKVLVRWGQASCELRQQGIHLHNIYWKTRSDIHDTYEG